MGDDPELLPAVAGDDPLGRLDRRAGPASGSLPEPNGIPWPIQRASVLYSGEPTANFLPPPWGICAVGFLRSRLGLGSGREDPTAPPFLDQRLVVRLRVEPQQAEPEPVLPGGLAVAAPGVAAVLREDRHDLADEVDRPGVGEVGDDDLDRRRPGPRPSTSIVVEPSPVGRIRPSASTVGDLGIAARSISPKP